MRQPGSYRARVRSSRRADVDSAISVSPSPTPHSVFGRQLRIHDGVQQLDWGETTWMGGMCRKRGTEILIQQPGKRRRRGSGREAGSGAEGEGRGAEEKTAAHG